MSAMAELDMDRRRLEQVSHPQRYAAAALIGECEAIVECGLLPEQNEMALRLLIADALAAFGMQHNDPFERDLDVIRQCLERT
jgi:hypothetical protein